MNLVSMITLLAGAVYIYLGYFGLKSDFRARIHQIFFLLCLACTWWAFCIALMFSAPERSSAWLLLRLSSPGWCMGPPLILHFTLYLTTARHTRRKRLLTLMAYLPGVFFAVLGLTVGVTSKTLVLRNFGWDNISATGSPVYWAYVAYYLLCVGISIAIVLYWGYHSHSKREKGQARVLAIFSFLGLLFASGSETLLPALGIASFPKMPVVLWLFWAFGMWYAISRYRFMILTPQIATAAIVSSITDMLIMLDAQGKITVVNNATQLMLGYTARQLVHHPASMVFFNKLFFQDLLRKAEKETVSAAKVELDYETRTGEKLPVMLSYSAIRDSFDELTGIVLVAQDLRPTRQLESQNAELEAISSSLLETNIALEKKSSQIKNILDNVGQGFLTFGSDLLIHDEYSAECSKIFGRSPEKQTLAQLIYPDDHEKKEFMERVFSRILSMEDEDRISLYLSLLPSEAEIQNRCISLEYKIVKPSATSEYIIAILTDITEKRFLEKKMEDERNTLQTLVKAIIYYDTLMECIDDFMDFAQYRAGEIMDSSWDLSQKISEIYRCIHTFKGNFSQFGSLDVVSRLHEMESFLGKAKDSNISINEITLKQMIQQSHMEQWLQDDLKKITDYLGNDFYRGKDTFKVSREKLQEIENKMIRLLSAEQYTLLLPCIRRLRYKSFKELLKPYPEYVVQLAERLGKSINTFSIEGDDILVDSDYYHAFIRSLIHVFRNVADHGIEYMDERMVLGKNVIGLVQCSVAADNDRIRLIISDDGAGIDMEKIAEAAIASGRYSEAEIAAAGEQELTDLIFEDTISTSNNVSMISGRGMGLAAVREETEKIKGLIRVESQPGAGTRYTFDLPVYRPFNMPEVTPNMILTAITRTIRSFIFDHTGLVFTDAGPIKPVSNITLNKYAAMINIRGIIDGILIITCSETLVKRLAPTFITADIGAEEESQVLEDVIAEIANIAAGNSLRTLGDSADFINISIPIVTSNWTAGIRQTHEQIYECILRDLDFEVKSIFIPV
ncbi:MAG TPA: ATP-binding protein [Syntrophomonadaceae bacterium]|nr:ATP-binding protein [Syntrophomonadaceae bacterium]